MNVKTERITKEPIITNQVKLIKMGNIFEIIHCSNPNKNINIKMYDKDNYIDLKTGEFKECNHITNRKENLNSLRRTFKTMRGYINANFFGEANELHIILTYAENMQDPKQLYTDMDKFIKKLKYHFGSSIEYITAVEPQERGAWHCHCLVKFKSADNIFIKNEIISKLWGNGFTKVKSLKDVDNIGAYLSAYLTNVVEEGDETTQSNKIKKGQRLHYYPPKMNIFRKSKGIVKPQEFILSYDEAKKIIGSAKADYQSETVISNDNKEIVNVITHQYYNIKRSNNQPQNITINKKVEKGSTINCNIQITVT